MARRQLSKSRRPPRVGGPLRTLLDERFVTHVELAAALGVHPQNVSRWVRNETGPQKQMLRRIAAYFEVEPATLVETSDKPDKAAA